MSAARTDRPLRIAVFGAGGVGGYFGGRLAESGHDVVFIARGAHLEAMRTHGLRVDSVLGDFVIRPTQATDDPRETGVVDVVLVAVKAWQVPEAAEAIRPLVGGNTIVVPMQNGVEAPEQLAAALGQAPVVGGLCRIVSFVEGPGHVRHTAAEPFVQFGELDDRPSTRLEPLRQAFERAGVAVEIPADIRRAMWLKFLFITPWSGVGAVTRVPIGVWRNLPETRRLCEGAAEEVRAVAQARGIDLPPDAVPKAMKMWDSISPEATASMQRDVMDGRPSELEAQVGAVVRIGRAHEVPTPVHDFMYGSLLPQERMARNGLT